ncbi:ABC transporter ATP-binding protein [Pseudomonas typographi]|uniref:ABC transporter ATP-binding protein n=1 Tax=Pseudomonas typographi TaxID=2715964 RepID=UPI001686F5E3|nr:ABC transporter ATP-binding protein [Pseudomonas typographi]MBD1588931.1 ABC transporter ATP-binding protein [Pseudomonas typographi]
MSVVDIKQVSKRYGQTLALNNVSMTIAQGEFFSLLGPSGGGKTSLLRSIAGFVEPDEGSIEIDGKPMLNVPINQRDLGMMFQNYALFPHMSIADNIGFGLSVRHRSKAEINQRIKELLSLVHLEGYGERRPRELSGGQQQRVALARALAPRPRVLLLDEPLGALDKKLRDEMQIELKKIQREVGVTTILVTHDQQEALTLSDRVAIINGGKVEQLGSPREVYERPHNQFVASFLGNANFFTGVVCGQADGMTQIRLPAGQVIHSSHGAGRSIGSRVTAAVRPEKLHAAGSNGPGQPCNRLSGRIAHEIYAGNSITYWVEIGAQQVSLTAQNNTAPALSMGAEAHLEWAPADTIVLD